MFVDEIPVGRAKDLRGQTYNRLTVLYRVKSKNQNRQASWKCRCICGKETIVDSYDLTSGHVKSCGCLQTETREAPKEYQRKNISNMRFGKLIAIEPIESHPKYGVKWRCKCDCGKVHEAYAHKLLEGSIQSCGCVKYNDIRGLRYGKLIALEPTNERDCCDSVIWKCQCDCGTITFVSVRRLNSNNTTSCGCIVSLGENKIKQLLTEHNISFISQKTFESCYSLQTGRPLRFDFYVSNKYIIEFDGLQHFEPVDFFGGEEEYLKLIERDKYKNQWCKSNNIPIIRIPYTKIDTLSIEDLKLETTNFQLQI